MPFPLLQLPVFVFPCISQLPSKAVVHDGNEIYEELYRMMHESTDQSPGGRQRRSRRGMPGDLCRVTPTRLWGVVSALWGL